ncbi:YiiX/YebB-like N1pC/P60 family cysteine hydrolase [Flavivirga eckloniae]|uniref:YiiX/YebB-like N1pC/P60 family cysteine hydrolase n=1 Tax=Flavivirga eckloniae TaxID=1803846 RepID=UPI001315750F|nr:YiiX/YebB-like N1pC/P60 family cysteine hydrolase [Flavivirga eckloniae]
MIKKEILKSGDIILMKSDSRLSRIIRKKSDSEFSHAILYMGGSSYIDSDGPGVQAHNIQRLIFDNEDDIIVLRLINSNQIDILNKIELFARQKIGTAYSLNEAIQVLENGTSLEPKEVNRQFCTRFVTQAYHSAGVDIVKNFNYPTPNDILNSKFLSEVKGVVRKASEREIKYAQSDSPLETQIEIHNSIFAEARKISNQDIQTFDQLHELIINHPEYDNEITEFLRNSGYLYMMENDFEKNPWHYDPEAFIEYYRSEKIMLKVINELSAIDKRINLALIETINDTEKELEKYNREFLKEHLSLYKKLKSYSDMRLDTINAVFKRITKL